MIDDQQAANASAPKAPAFSVKSGLVASVERILRRSLTGEEVQHWNSIQDQFGIADDDPIVIVLTLLAMYQHLFNDLPKQIQEATDKALAVHRTTLEDQATIVSKALLAKLAPMFVQAAQPADGRSERGGLVKTWMVAVAGVVCGGFGVALLELFLSR